MPRELRVVRLCSLPVRKKSPPLNSTTLGSLLLVTWPERFKSRSRSRAAMRSRARNWTFFSHLEFNSTWMRVRNMSLLIGKRVSFMTGSSTTTGGLGAFLTCDVSRMLRAILSVTATRSCDSTPVPATKPFSSARISVTPMPEGFFTPLEAHPANIATTTDGPRSPDNIRVFIKWFFRRSLRVPIQPQHNTPSRRSKIHLLRQLDQRAVQLGSHAACPGPANLRKWRPGRRPQTRRRNFRRGDRLCLPRQRGNQSSTGRRAGG